MNIDQKKKITFLHHALWCLSIELSAQANIIEEDGKASKELLTAHNSIAQFAEQNQERYCRAIAKGGIMLLNDTIT